MAHRTLTTFVRAVAVGMGPLGEYSAPISTMSRPVKQPNRPTASYYLVGVVHHAFVCVIASQLHATAVIRYTYTHIHAQTHTDTNTQFTRIHSRTYRYLLVWTRAVLMAAFAALGLTPCRQNPAGTADFTIEWTNPAAAEDGVQKYFLETRSTGEGAHDAEFFALLLRSFTLQR